jgi:hypothetical protein
MSPSWSNLPVAALLLAALTACGSSERKPDEPQVRPGAERITAQGVAALVAEHLGAENVRRYGTYGQEEGSVDVMVQLRGADRRDMFVVGVSSPEKADQEFHTVTEISCKEMERPAGRRGGRLWCEDFADGGVVFVQLTPYGFSDDNADGKVLMGVAAEPDGRLANAMYESYTPTVGVDPEDLLALMADERLAWSTDPAVNDAGREIAVRPIPGD